jgi:pimeloyl-ACP methyl ester carboxylesterase
MPRNFTGPKPICAHIIDSSPGGEDRESAVRAFTDSIQRPFLRSVFRFLFIALYNVLQFFGELFGRPNPIAAYKRDLNRVSSPDNPSKPDLVSPWFTLKTPRLYLFSKSDRMVPWKEVEAHAEAAKQCGFSVRTEIFEDTPHCAHGRAHPERYWAAVRDVWNDALKVVRDYCRDWSPVC